MKPSARELRWARNRVRSFRSAFESGRIYLPDGKTEAHWVSRYRRAVAMLVAEALRKD